MDTKEKQLVSVYRVFKYVSGDENHTVHVAGTAESPLFCAKDVCLILNVVDVSRTMDRLRAEEKSIHFMSAIQGKQGLIFITESGLYRLIFTSNNPEAEKFKDWVFQEVLPSIRKTGSYQLPFAENQARINLLRSGAELLNYLGTLDDRAKAILTSNALNSITDGISTRENPDEEEYSISHRVQEKCGRNLNSKKHKDLLCRLGKRMAKEYRSRRGHSPKTRSQYVDGTLRKIKQYTKGDFENFGDELLDGYFSTD